MAAGDLSIPPGFAQLTFYVSNSTVGHRCVWTIGAALSGGGLTPGQGAALFVAASGALAPIWDSAVTQQGFHALIGSDGPPMALDIAGNVQGSASILTMAPPNVSYLVKKTTAFAGRQYRGRLYLPFVPTNELSEAGTFIGATATRLTTAMVNLFAAPGTGSTTGVTGWVLLHRETPAGAAPAPTPITSFQPTFTVATQRRRLER
jgi:hypothetical protein